MNITVDLRDGRGECPFRYFGMARLEPYCQALNQDCTDSGKKRPPYNCPLLKGTVIVRGAAR